MLRHARFRAALARPGGRQPLANGAGRPNPPDSQAAEAGRGLLVAEFGDRVSRRKHAGHFWHQQFENAAIEARDSLKDTPSILRRETKCVRQHARFAAHLRINAGSLDFVAHRLEE